MGFALFTSLGGGAAGVSETADRVVASLGNEAITQSEVEAEYRFELFLDGKVPGSVPDTATLMHVCDRLIEQKLLAEEATAEKTESEDPPGNTTGMLEEVRKKFGSQEAFESAVHSLGLDEREMLARFAIQEKTLRMIEQRFRPAAWPERAGIETYYRETFLPEYALHHSGPAPPLADVEDKIREILVERNINRLLEAWLTEMKSSRRVRVHDF